MFSRPKSVPIYATKYSILIFLILLVHKNVEDSILISANLVATSAGCAMTWTSPTLPKLQQPNDRLFVTKEQGAWIGSFLPLGACFGPLVATLIVDKIGKKFSLILCAMIILIHWIVIAMINTLEGIYFARFLTGMAVGSVFNLLPIYVAEISSVILSSEF